MIFENQHTFVFLLLKTSSLSLWKLLNLLSLSLIGSSMFICSCVNVEQNLRDCLLLQTFSTSSVKKSSSLGSVRSKLFGGELCRVLSFSSQYPSCKKAKKAHNPTATFVTKALDKSKRLLGDCIVLCLFSDTSKLSLTRVLTIFTRCWKDEFSFTSYVCFCKLPTDNSLATAKFTSLLRTSKLSLPSLTLASAPCQFLFRGDL